MESVVEGLAWAGVEALAAESLSGLVAMESVGLVLVLESLS